MIKIRKSDERGHANHGWLDSYHTFSFADYYDPEHVGFRDLLVINDDKVEASKGFGTHPHRDMEIITYVLDGELEHKDSMGTGSVIKPGDVQRMTAGTGVQHSEFNHSEKNGVRLLQIWITPDRRGHTPSYEQKAFSEQEKRNQLKLVASNDGRDSSITVHQDVSLFAAVIDSGKKVNYDLEPFRHAWLQVARGSIEVNGILLTEGDGAAISDEKKLTLIGADKKAEILLFDLA